MALPRKLRWERFSNIAATAAVSRSRNYRPLASGSAALREKATPTTVPAASKSGRRRVRSCGPKRRTVRAAQAEHAGSYEGVMARVTTGGMPARRSMFSTRSHASASRWADRIDQGLSVEVFTLAERPELLEPALSLGGVGSKFMQNDWVGRLAASSLLRDRWPELFSVLLDGGKVVARAVSIPFAMGTEGRDELPDHGWDGVLVWAAEDALQERKPNVVAALDIQVAADRRGSGFSAIALAALRDNATRCGFDEVVAPVRPPGKAQEPRGDITEYAWRCREDGLPVDPWLRVHVRAGGEIVKVAPFSMTVQGTLEQWRAWTGLEFDRDGLIDVEGGLVPVVVALPLDLAVYVEPNVWVRHRLA